MSKSRLILEPLKGCVNASSNTQTNAIEAPLTEPKINPISHMKKQQSAKNNKFEYNIN